VIRVLLVAGATGALVALLSTQGSAGIRAGRRLLFVGIVVVFVTAALQPRLVNDVAQAIGVGRGADLVLYVLATAFLYLVLYTYQKHREQQGRIAELVRHVAILEARLEADKPRS
jgi:hypothetical protein